MSSKISIRCSTLLPHYHKSKESYQVWSPTPLHQDTSKETKKLKLLSPIPPLLASNAWWNIDPPPKNSSSSPIHWTSNQSIHSSMNFNIAKKIQLHTINATQAFISYTPHTQHNRQAKHPWSFFHFYSICYSLFWLQETQSHEDFIHTNHQTQHNPHPSPKKHNPCGEREMMATKEQYFLTHVTQSQISHDLPHLCDANEFHAINRVWKQYIKSPIISSLTK